TPETLLRNPETFSRPTETPSKPMCHDWGQRGELAVLEGEAGWLSCPLFSYPSIYNYSSAQSAGLTLFWYHIPAGHVLEQPIKSSQRLSKERERLWLQPAAANDTGQYICMLRNISSCTKIAMRLDVLPHNKTVPGGCRPPFAVAPEKAVITLQRGETLECPDLQEVADSNPKVTWYHLCERVLDVRDMEVKHNRLEVHLMLVRYQGLFSCTVQFRRRDKDLQFSRSINVTAVSKNPSQSKLPHVLHPTKDQLCCVLLCSGAEMRLDCRGFFPYLEGESDIWWTIDGKRVDTTDPRLSTTNRDVHNDHEDRTLESILLIQDFQPEDLKREYNCSVKNELGFDTRRAQLKEEVSVPVVELSCGLGVTLLLMLTLFVVYHIFWLELLLITHTAPYTDPLIYDKEFDVYISYARNSEEEQFVLSTLRSVLENELGYSVCIFDRDSLPGGTITDETLSFVTRSRRLLVVVSPGYASQGSQALLELKAGIDSMALGGHLRVILVQYRPVRRQGWVRELRRARLALALVRWQGDKSRELTSRFWKRLRVELPVRRVTREGEKGLRRGSGEEDMSLRRLQSQNSTSSQTGLITNTMKDPQAVLNCATGM
uniref:Interleukin 1 receptor accessory protein n=1 Tax=Myripristis murdjan TaxID=586833 RepID=A0A668AJX2_9TELE